MESIAEYLKEKNESVSRKIKMVGIISEVQNKVKRMKKLRIVSETIGMIANALTFELEGSQKKKRKIMV